MATKEELHRVKSATVAIAFLLPEKSFDPKVAPFYILGSGFCIDKDGIIVTCEYVVNAFGSRDIRQMISEIRPEDKTGKIWPIRNVQMMIPHAVFMMPSKSGNSLLVSPVPISSAMAKIDYDIGLLKLQRHPSFKDGYPFLELEEKAQLYEGMEIATCGFPLGNELQRQIGTMTSSFTRGILSSVIPSPNVNPKHVTAYQLDVTATNGNSGGPVFAWSTGKVFGVLQGAPIHPNKLPVPGLAKAESIYRIIDDGTLERFRSGPPEIPK